MSDPNSQRIRIVMCLNYSGLSADHAEAHYQLAVVLSRHQQAEGIQHYREAVRLKPNWIEHLNNLAWILATSADGTLRDGKQAIDFAARTVELTHAKDAEAWDTLAAAYAAAGSFPEAIQ